MHEFLNSVKKYPQWPHSNKHKGNSKDFQNAFEIMFVVLWSIWDKPYWENSPSNDTPSTPKEEEFRKIRKKEFEENLYLYGKRTGITEERQKELIRKVKNAHWDAPEFIRSYGFTEKDNKRKSGFKKFAEAYLRICLDDRVIEYSELRLIYLAVYFLNIDLHELTHLYRKTLKSIRYRAIVFFERPIISIIITSLIILNAIQLGMIASCSWISPQSAPWFFKLDFYFMLLFSFEILCRIFAFRKEYFAAPQNWFDFIIIVLSWIPIPGLRHIAPLRVLRTLLLINRLKQFKVIMKSLIYTIPNISWVFMLMGLFYFVFSLLTTRLFGHEFEIFSTVPKSLFTLFQLMTLEGWPDIVKNVMTVYPYAWLLFIPFILITSYVLLNLVIGIIVTVMQDFNIKSNETEKKELEEIRQLRTQIKEISEQLTKIKESMEKTKND